MPSKIEWCDETINPQGWGCWGPGGTPEKPQRCWYCYARRMAARKMRPCELCNQFIPHWHPEMLDKPHRWKKRRRIFVQSMGDLLHPCTSSFRIELVLALAKSCPWHTLMFLTKNPARYQNYNPWPANCWVGTTVTNQTDADERLPWLLQVEAPVRFVSHEPLLGKIYLDRPIPFGYIPDKSGWEAGTCEGHIDAFTGKWCPITSFRWINGRFGKIDWAIIGGMTGPGAVKPKPEWIQGLVDQYRAAGVPVFLKNNLNWPGKIQEWPCPR